MRVLMVTHSYPRYAGDITAPFVESIARSIAARGHEVDLVLPHHPELRRYEDEPVKLSPYRYAPTDALSSWGYGQSLKAGLNVRRRLYPILPFVAFFLRRHVARLLTQAVYDVVHVHWVVPNAVFLASLVRDRGVPLVVSVHGSDISLAERVGPARVLTARAFRAAGAITAPSGDLRRRCLTLGAAAEKTRTVAYGVDTRVFSPDVAAGEIRDRLGVPANAFLVVAVGRLIEVKGFRYLIEAAARIDGLHAVIAGDGDLRAVLQRQIDLLGAPVRLVGALDRGLVPRVLAAADALVIPSVVDSAGNVDGLPNTLLESLATGRPVIATRVGGIPDVIEDEVNGLLVPARDPDALALALRRLMGEAKVRDRLGRAARLTATERLTWEAAASAFEECYILATTSRPV